MTLASAQSAEWVQIRTDDGRVLESYVAGDEDAFPLLFISGTPSAATPHARTLALAAGRKLRMIEFSRPGYAGSTPLPGRDVASIASDAAAVLDALGADTFVAIGFSGGGPHALACGALLPERCLAAATVGGVAPYPAEGIDWFAGMAPENVDEFRRSIEGEAALVPFLVQAGAQLADVDASDITAALGELLSDVDKEALAGDFAEWIAESFRRAVSAGIAGWRDDDFAFVKPWGFALSQILRPVAVWQGRQDRMVPFAHGEWLCEHIPSATAHLLESEGHLSLAHVKLPDVLDDLLARAGIANGDASRRHV
jgi:pimeloyl-ACP methyl ester carboxylesterase